MSNGSHVPPVGASDWDTELFAMLRSHVAKERSLLGEYVLAAKETNSRALAYLVDLLIQDERRHHRIFIDMAASLKAEAELNEEGPVVPRVDFDRANASAVIDVTDRLLANEKDDLRELKRIKQMMGSVEGTTLWTLLIDIMERDTDKHIAILRFANRQAKRRQSK
jgi:rubrerythrin